MKIFQLDNISEFDISEVFKDVVVIPTETVYGLAAPINNEYALKRIFSIKDRPSDNPLIVHIGSMDQLYEIVEFIPKCYEALMEAFWPGPLTLIFQAKHSVSSVICGRKRGIVDGNSRTYRTIAVRMPQSDRLRQIITGLGTPLAAPSANTSGKPSPTNIGHVLEDLGDKVPSYIDGGQCEYGLESTVFFYNCNNQGAINKYVLLRPGAVTKEHLEQVLQCEVSYKNKAVAGEEVISPGMKYRHYSPSVPLYLFVGSDWVKNMNHEMDVMENRLKIGLMLEDSYCSSNAQGVGLSNCFKVFNMGRDIVECCRNCFSGLKHLEKSCDIIFVQGFSSDGEGRAFMDRVEKAATKILG